MKIIFTRIANLFRPSLATRIERELAKYPDGEEVTLESLKAIIAARGNQ
jgi:hypothetical protein